MSELIHLEDYESTRDWRRIGRAIHFLTERYTEQPRLEDAADAVGLSPFHFQRLFTRYVGVSPKSFIGHLTLEHAKRELANGASVMDAAIESGLSGSSRLHDLSLKIEAMTPGEYAKGARGLSIDYGFADCPFGRVLVMATAKGVCGLAFGDEGEDERMLADMTSRWPRADFALNAKYAEEIAQKIFEHDGKAEIGLHLLGTPFQIKVWEALLAWAFRVSTLAARRSERVTVTPSRLRVEQYPAKGAVTEAEFNPYWVRVDLQWPTEFSNRLFLRSHGRELQLGAFLAPAVRESFANALKSAISAAKNPRF
jgi:AraC family transcriptional regulator of adaptative response/methylated-DNA-[protein]-cysteine methyltransferase